MADLAPAARVSWEQAAIAELRELIGDRVLVEAISGMAAINRVAPTDWKLDVMQRFQFGDLRYEIGTTRLVVEVESGGGLTNLVKYWPMLGRELSDRRFVLTHVFKVGSKSDYIAHRRLWDYVLERMRSDLESRGCSWGSDWEAGIFTYGHSSAPHGIARAADYIAHQLARA